MQPAILIYCFLSYYSFSPWLSSLVYPREHLQSSAFQASTSFPIYSSLYSSIHFLSFLFFFFHLTDIYLVSPLVFTCPTDMLNQIQEKILYRWTGIRIEVLGPSLSTVIHRLCDLEQVTFSCTLTSVNGARAIIRLLSLRTLKLYNFYCHQGSVQTDKSITQC